jgi:hypothetical protein
MKLDIVVTLDSGGTVTVRGENLSADAVNEVFTILARYTVESSPHAADRRDPRGPPRG